MRRVLAVLTLAAALGAAATTAAPPVPHTTFVLAGGGWGHGVGMSQWGALGQAKAGRDYRQILTTYYRGTEMGSAPATLLERVRVLVADGLATATVANVLAVFDGNGRRYPIPAATLTVKPDLKLPVGKDGKQVALPGPVTIRATQGAFLAYRGKEFRGDLRVANVSARVRLVNVVGLEAYLLGVVPGEMPKDSPIRRPRRHRPSQPAPTQSAASSPASRSTSIPTGAARSTTASTRRHRGRARPCGTRSARS